MDKQHSFSFRNVTLLVLGTVALYWGLNHLEVIGKALGTLIGFASPFLIGCGLAFLMNIPMRAVERGLSKAGSGAWVRPVSIVVTLILVLGVISAVVFVVAPQIGTTVASIRDRFPGFIRECEALAAELSKRLPEITVAVNNIGLDLNKLTSELSNWLSSLGKDVLSSSLNLATSVFSGVVTFSIAFVFALYILAGKEKLGRQMVHLMRAYLPGHLVDEVLRVCRLTGDTFSSFFTGQCLEACILGFMFFVAMSIFRFPFALLVAVLVGFTALIPVFGAFIGCVVGAFLILVENPIQALWFIVLFLVLQQVEGNLIYPRVVGSSVGLPPIWVLVAVTIGGSTSGVVGMLLFIPTASVLYALLRQNVRRRLKAQTAQQAPPRPKR